MFEDADNFADIFRNLPYCLLLALPILIIFSSNPVLASSEFGVHRMSQFDVNGINYGCRASAISFEAKSLYSWSTARHCVVAKFQDMSIDQFREIRKKAGGIIICLPRDVSTLSFDEKEHLNLLEQEMLSQSSPIPVYFSVYNEELERIIADVTRTTSEPKINGAEKNGQRDSAISELFNSISANGYQVVVSGSNHAPNKNSRIAIIQGELGPVKYIKQKDNKLDGNFIVITAHLNTFGVYNEYPLNADLAVLMIIAELFSKLSVSTAPKYRLMFLVSESGPLLNFQGVKKWLDENVQLQNLDFVLCLDTIVKSLESQGDNEGFYMHVSKPPKEGTPMNKFYKILKMIGARHSNVTIDGVHKRINLADQLLAWEHERFSIKRLSAFTLSAMKTPKDPSRLTIFKDSERRILKQTEQSAKIISEALARYVYDIDDDEDGEIFADATAINEKIVKSYINIKSALHNNDLRNVFEKHLKNVKLIYEKPDIREPDFMFYEGLEANLNVYSVKPAVFDLLLTMLISIYLVSVYFIIIYFPQFYDIVCKFSKAQIVTTNGNSNHSSSDRLKAKAN